ncbi:hypothetical protein GIB67_001603 [Kingdonia uniflora]|uniref:Diphthine--ammonia ligase n=1 Tax=Kingdonia uniflora TaxID=39325 RepID=A0A7J7L0X3_9MAGN|nr:hypothetical protein GIB67_001603 [Kingdonia uniflora]
MKVVGLISGGKDSCFAMMKCVEYGHEIVALANLMPLDDSVDELDSYMYQTVGHQIVVCYAGCMGLPLFRRRIHGSTRHQNLSYKRTQGDEVEDMLKLLAEVKREIPCVMAVSSGAIASDYQRLRVESVCSRLGLISLAYLWKQDQSLLLQEMITKGIVAITVKVAAMGLQPAKHLGKEISYLQNQLHQLKERYGINVCGEGGEYETLTLDCPLFKNARIVLDNFQVIMHSSGSIAPVGVLHPSTFHLEHKEDFASVSTHNNTSDSDPMALVCEVLGDCVSENEVKFQSQELPSEFVSVTNVKLHVAKTIGKDTFSMGCWIHDPCGISEGLQKDLTSILGNLEVRLFKDGFGWANVLYIHLYIASMNEFALANETYVSFITEEKCHLGVPSRSTIELSLTQVGLGKAYVEILVANDLRKRVLHVQSISCWAPSCIGPYSQATLHKEVLYMAGQLGLDPPTMKFCSVGAVAELEQALENCKAVAESFNCSLGPSAILFVIYCSQSLTSSQRTEIQGRLEGFLQQRASDMDNENVSRLFDPVILFVLAPDLPKSALIEVKPILYVPDDKETETESETSEPLRSKIPNYGGFEYLQLHDTCCQKYVVPGKICIGMLSIQDDLAATLCSEKLKSDQNRRDCRYFGTQKHMKVIVRFCIYLLDKILLDHGFTWENITNLRFYFPTTLGMPSEILSVIFMDAFSEFSEMNQRMKLSKEESIFNLIPVLGAGRSAESMNDIITCELFASKL